MLASNRTAKVLIPAASGGLIQKQGSTAGAQACCTERQPAAAVRSSWPNHAGRLMPRPGREGRLSVQGEIATDGAGGCGGKCWRCWSYPRATVARFRPETCEVHSNERQGEVAGE